MRISKLLAATAIASLLASVSFGQSGGTFNVDPNAIWRTQTQQSVKVWQGSNDATAGTFPVYSGSAQYAPLLVHKVSGMNSLVAGDAITCPQTYPVTGASGTSTGTLTLTFTNATSSTFYPFTTGQHVIVANVGGTTEANGEGVAAATPNGTTIVLSGRSLTNAYTSGGTVRSADAFLGNRTLAYHLNTGAGAGTHTITLLVKGQSGANTGASQEKITLSCAANSDDVQYGTIPFAGQMNGNNYPLTITVVSASALGSSDKLDIGPWGIGATEVPKNYSDIGSVLVNGVEYVNLPNFNYASGLIAQLTTPSTQPVVPTFNPLFQSVSPGPKYKISAATTATPIVITTTVPHKFVTGDKVTVSGITVGNMVANNNWTITRVSATTFSLDGSVGSGTATVTGAYAIMQDAIAPFAATDVVELTGYSRQFMSYGGVTASSSTIP